MDAKKMVKEQNKVFNLPSPLHVGGYMGWFEAGEKGRGMVALRDIAADVMLERNPVVILPSDVLCTADGEESVLENYMFRWGPEDDNQMTAECCWALGNIPLVNHSATPNCDIRQDETNRVMELFSLRAIAQGEEITIDYDLGDDIWFDAKE